jgi:hypothetical protein
MGHKIETVDISNCFTKTVLAFKNYCNGLLNKIKKTFLFFIFLQITFLRQLSTLNPTLVLNMLLPIAVSHSIEQREKYKRCRLVLIADMD